MQDKTYTKNVKTLYICFIYVYVCVCVCVYIYIHKTYICIHAAAAAKLLQSCPTL